MRRLLFASPSRTSRRAPFYFALLAVAALGLIGFGVVSGPEEPTVPSSQRAALPATPPGKASDGGQQIPLPLRTPGPRSHWM